MFFSVLRLGLSARLFFFRFLSVIYCRQSKRQSPLYGMFFLIIITIIMIFLLLKSFSHYFCWWSFTGGWVTSILLKSLGLFSVFSLYSIVVWMFSTHTLISMSSSTFNHPLVTIPKAPNTIGVIVNFMFHIFFIFYFPSKVEELIFRFTFLQFLWSAGTAKSRILLVPFICWLLGLVFSPILGDPFYVQVPYEFMSVIL